MSSSLRIPTAGAEVQHLAVDRLVAAGDTALRIAVSACVLLSACATQDLEEISVPDLRNDYRNLCRSVLQESFDDVLDSLGPVRETLEQYDVEGFEELRAGVFESHEANIELCMSAMRYFETLE